MGILAVPSSSVWLLLMWQPAVLRRWCRVGIDETASQAEVIRGGPRTPGLYREAGIPDASVSSTWLQVGDLDMATADEDRTACRQAGGLHTIAPNGQRDGAHILKQKQGQRPGLEDVDVSESGAVGREVRHS